VGFAIASITSTIQNL